MHDAIAHVIDPPLTARLAAWRRTLRKLSLSWSARPSQRQGRRRQSKPKRFSNSARIAIPRCRPALQSLTSINHHASRDGSMGAPANQSTCPFWRRPGHVNDRV